MSPNSPEANQVLILLSKKLKFVKHASFRLVHLLVRLNRKKRKWKSMKMEKSVICKRRFSLLLRFCSTRNLFSDIRKVQRNSIRISGFYKTSSPNLFNYGIEHHGIHLYMYDDRFSLFEKNKQTITQFSSSI